MKTNTFKTFAFLFAVFVGCYAVTWTIAQAIGPNVAQLEPLYRQEMQQNKERHDLNTEKIEAYYWHCNQAERLEVENDALHKRNEQLRELLGEKKQTSTSASISIRVTGPKKNN